MTEIERARVLANRLEGRHHNGGRVIRGMAPIMYETADLLRELADALEAAKKPKR